MVVSGDVGQNWTLLVVLVLFREVGGQGLALLVAGGDPWCPQGNLDNISGMFRDVVGQWLSSVVTGGGQRWRWS